MKKFSTFTPKQMFRILGSKNPPWGRLIKYKTRILSPKNDFIFKLIFGDQQIAKICHNRILPIAIEISLMAGKNFA
jgi:hypothetical protein